MADRAPLRIKDVIRLTRLGYGYVRRSLISGKPEGLVTPRLLQTNEETVEAWLCRLKNEPRSVASSSSDEAVTQSPKPKACGAYRHLDPSKYGSRSL